MNYERFTDELGNEHIAIYRLDGSRVTFPASEDNQHYVRFLEELEQEAQSL